jgi:amino acid adenylation domain-containing protein
MRPVDRATSGLATPSTNAGRALPEQTVVARFLTVATERGDAPAVVTPEGADTYDDMARRAAVLARTLTDRGVTRGDLVGLVQHKTSDLVASQIAVLAVGAAYVPVAVNAPPSRVAGLLADAGARVVLADGFHHDGLVVVDVTTVRGSGNCPLALPDAARPDDPAYVMYTSGSTGQPKGVVVNHRAVLSRVVDVDYVTLGPGTATLQTGAVSFDAATFEVWAPLLNGGRLVLRGDAPAPDAKSMRAAVREHGALTVFLTTPLFNEIVDQDPSALDHCEVLVGGDTNSPRHVAAAAAACPDARIRPVYGPTECTTFATIAPPAGTTQHDRVPIGLPIDRTVAVVLNPDGEPVPDGETGELWLGGEGLALGYLNSPDLTEERFRLMDHLEPGLRLYRTGDLARWDESGQLQHVGRVDRQVKIRGFRVEPAEVEHAMRLHVADAVVLPVPSPSGQVELVAYFVAEDDVSLEALDADLSRALPDYLLPRRYRQVDAWPLTAHHKVDRDALSRLKGLPPRDTRGAGEAPAGAHEEAVAAAFADVLGLAEVHRSTSFFDVGGHSLLAMRVWSRLRSDLGVDFELRTVLDHPTVAGLAEAVAKAPAAAPRPALRATTV